MTTSDIAIASVSFISFVLLSVVCFLFVAKHITRLPLSFYLLVSCACSLWVVHGCKVNDITLICSAGFGTLASLIILGFRVYYIIKPRMDRPTTHRI